MGELDRLASLPVFRSDWLPGQVLVGGPRFGKTLSVNEFRRLYLNDPSEASMPTFYDSLYSTSTNSTTSTTTASITYNPAYYSNVSTQPKYLVSYGDAEWVNEPAKPKKPKPPETPRQWLERRIEEVSWVPA